MQKGSDNLNDRNKEKFEKDAGLNTGTVLQKRLGVKAKICCNI